MGKYATKENEIDILLRTGRFVDLHRILRQSIRAGVERYSLKDLEQYHGFIREMDLRTLSKIKAKYEFLLESKKFEMITPEMKDAIQLYNQEDCFSTQHLHLWLENERGQLINNGEHITRPEKNETEEPEKINAHLEKIQPIYDALMEGIPADASERNLTEQAQYLLANMLDWYRREEKSVWWEYFRLLEMEADELMNEKAAIGYMQFTGERKVASSSFIDTYTFPPQEYEMKVGDKLKNQEGKWAGQIVAIDEMQNLISIKQGPSIQGVVIESVIKFDKISNAKKVETLIRIAEWIVDNGLDSETPKYRVTRDLLLNRLPNYREELADVHDALAESIDRAYKLDHSYLAIQGPPGAGKSYTASRTIFELIKRGKRIGVTALSHKVIINLLEKIKEVADEQNFDLKIIYKDSIKEDTGGFWLSQQKVEILAAQISDFHVIAGTSFMWCDARLYDSVDYLFIDEAGQFSLIDTVVVSHAAKNLVLLGDHQQLKQPIKGLHPEGTDVSALEHILEGNKTIPEQKGIFLEKTWRMHPTICSFDSEMFYESRLSSTEGLEHHRIDGNTPFAGSGLVYQSVAHTGNTSMSAEEVEVIEGIVNNLTKGDVFWTNEKQQRNVLTAEHIKIITPYNSNVFALQKRLPQIAVGTVDKFQGQEAPVIIYSVASSSPEDAPRGMDFLYSPNRLNVAVSRAKAIFIMVGSPRIFEPDCKSPEQIKLANPFCRFMEVASMVD